VLKLSILTANEHLFATILDIFPLSSFLAFPMYEELNKIPYFGVFPLVFNALNNAFSAPKICIVDAGYLAKFVSDPEWAINLAPTNSPMMLVKFGAILFILSVRKSYNFCLKDIKFFIFLVKLVILIRSKSLKSTPIEHFDASTNSNDFSSSPINIVNLDNVPSSSSFYILIKLFLVSKSAIKAIII